MSWRAFYFAVTAALLAFAAPARAVVLDWDAVNWAAGSLSNSYDVDPAAAGTDVSVVVTGSTAFSVNDTASGSPTPVNNTSLQGGLSPVQKSLVLATQFNNSSQNITVTVNFSAQYTGGVTDVMFTLFNIQKRSNIQDLISSISAVDINGNLIAPTITNVGSAVTLAGTGLTQTLTGSGAVPATGSSSGNGNATISFTGAIRSFSFTFSNATGAPNPGAQNIGIWDISYTPVPELNPVWTGFASCLIAGALMLHHRGLLRKKRE